MPPSVTVRTDLFDHMTSLTRPMEEVRNQFVSDCQMAFPALFPSFDDAARYVNSLGTKAIAELFCEMARFYKVSKEDVSIDVIQFTMVLTIIERIQSHGRTFLSPWDFLSQRANVELATEPPIADPGAMMRLLVTMALTIIDRIRSRGKTILSMWGFLSRGANVESAATPPIADLATTMRLLETLKQNYSAAHVATRGVVDFFQTYASDADKILLAKSLKTQRTQHLVGASSRFDRGLAGLASITDAAAGGFRTGEGNLPRCYNWKNCYIEFGDCHPAEGCDLTADAAKMALTIKKLVQLLYAWRSKFDHEGVIPPISDTTFIAETDRGLIINDMTINMFRTIFERSFEAYFDRHILQLAPADPQAPPAV